MLGGRGRVTLAEPFVPAEAGAGAPSHSHAIPGHPAGHAGEGAQRPVMGLGQADSWMLNREAQLRAARGWGRGGPCHPSARPTDRKLPPTLGSLPWHRPDLFSSSEQLPLSAGQRRLAPICSRAGASARAPLTPSLPTQALVSPSSPTPTPGRGDPRAGNRRG